MSDIPWYSILDHKGFTKHAFFIGKDPDAIFDEEFNLHINTWQFGAQKMLERYRDLLFSGDALFPRRLLVAHDGGHAYRSALFPAYKKKRAEKPRSAIQTEQLKQLDDWAKAFFAAIGATQIYVKGVEADDIIAWLCEGLKDDPKGVFTVDGDLTQLVDDNTVVFLKGEPVTEDMEGYQGCPYDLIALEKAILGDKSDEYPGVAGMGPAAWAKLVDLIGFEGLRSLRDHVLNDDPTLLDGYLQQEGMAASKELRKLRTEWPTLRKMYRLARLHPELCWKPRGGKMVKPMWHKRVADPVKTKRLLEQAGMADLWPEFEEIMPRLIAITADNYDEYLPDIIEEMKAGDVTAFDYETYDTAQVASFQEAKQGYVDMLNQSITGCGMCFGRHGENVVYFANDHADTNNLTKGQVFDALVAADEHTQLVAHNSYFELTVTARNFDDARLSGVHDTQIMQRYVDENQLFNLKDSAARELGMKMATYEETTNGRPMNQLTLPEVLQYGCDDAIATFHLYDLLMLKAKLDGCWDHYVENVVDATPTIVDSFLTGTQIDWGMQKEVHASDIKLRDESHARLRKLLQEHCSNPTQPEQFAGAKAYADAEREYIIRKAKRDFVEKREKDGLPAPTLDEIRDVQRDAFEQFKEKCVAAVRYVPWVSEEVMPPFSPTPVQLSAAAEALGLPPVEKLTQAFLRQYITESGLGSFGGKELTDDQKQWLTAFSRAVHAGVFSKKDMSEEDAEARQVALDTLGRLTQKFANVQPRVITDGDELSMGSTAQKLMILHCKMGLPVRLRGKLSDGRMKLGLKEGSPAAKEIALKTAISEDTEESDWQREALTAMMECMSAITRIQLYHNKYPLWRREDGRIHNSIMLCGTDTRRPTGSSPNILQVPKKDKRLRQLHVPPTKDHLVVAIDFSSQELRIIANESGDATMLSVYDPHDEKGLHEMTASGILNLTYAQYMKVYDNPDDPQYPHYDTVRSKLAKGVNFGIAYGAGPPTLAVNLMVTLEVAQELFAKTMATYPGISIWQDKTGKFMEEKGFTVNAYGTKRHASEDLYSGDGSKISRQKRQGTNATIQGCAAEMLNRILTQVWRTDMLLRFDMSILAPVYDEIVAYVHKDDVYAYCHEMRQLMVDSTPPSHTVPQVPEFSIGYSWGTVHELKRDISPENINKHIERALEEGQANYWNRVTAQ